MDTAALMELPSLSRERFEPMEGAIAGGAVHAYTDEGLFASLGVRIAFTERMGGVSQPPFDELNLATHVNDDVLAVQRNRRHLLGALGFPEAQLIMPKQVHGTHVAVVRDVSLEEAEDVREQTRNGADAVVVDRSQTAALFSFADCVPLIMVAPSGAFAVIHAGWRGVYAHLAVKALYKLCGVAGCEPDECNIYFGPYIHAECFEVSADLAQKFGLAFGPESRPDERHVDLGAAIRCDLDRAGAKRIADVGKCTSCDNVHFFSFRAQAGVCGRHGAFAARRT